MTTGISSWVTPDPVDTDASDTILETTIVTSLQTVDIGGGVMANAEVYNGAIPGPTLRLNVGDTLIVRLVNNLPHPSGIHWHGIEMGNSADGTPFTQNPVPAGGTFLYKFKVPRPGIYWYHPHHHHSTNRVFRGTYGMIVVTDPHEEALIDAGTLPGAADTIALVLSDITVCKAAGLNDTVTYSPSLPWLGPNTSQPAPTPADLCEINPLNEDGTPAPPGFAFGAGDVPNIQLPGAGRTNEGQTVLTNGMNVGARGGSPTAPGALAAGAQLLPVRRGQGLRLQIVNCATTRYFRLILTLEDGTQVDLVRVGGEGGLLDNAVVEGGVGPGFNFKYTAGEILIPPASRADVVAAIPASAAGVLTMWTQDIERTGAGFARIPTVPVMHLEVTGAPAESYVIADGTPLRAAIPDASVEVLPAPTGVLLDPATFTPAKPGMSSQIIQITAMGGVLGIDAIHGHHPDHDPYTDSPHFDSSRYAESDRVLELSVSNPTGAHHPFHLHGFSVQPISLTPTAGPAYTWPYREFRDNIDIPSNTTLVFRVRTEDRELDDGVTMGGSLGRWLFHCHIFFHAHQGMTSELVITAADGREKPNVDVGGSWAYTPSGGIATRSGTFSHPDGLAVTLSASMGTVTPTGATTWSWELDSTGLPDQVQYVYITATDSAGRQDQTVFRLKIGAPDDGADNGDPHVHTVDGKRYDFQGVGEFVLLRDRDGMEVQARHTPVQTATPITDSYSGLTSCVSVNTAVAARVGSHRISYQPGQGGELQVYLDGKPVRLPDRGMDLDGHHVSPYDAGGARALRVDYAHHAVLTVTPYFWATHSMWLLNVRVAHTHGDEGIMGVIPRESWLPALPSGATVGPRPDSLHDRYVSLYRTFANAWRVTDATSLFVYEPGTSTATFTDEDWPAEQVPCVLKPQFEIPGVPVPQNLSIAQAERICLKVTEDDLHRDCVFDVATTGDEAFANGYLLAQELRFRGTTVQVIPQPCRHPGGAPEITAVVLPMSSNRPTPTGSVAFIVDGAAVGPTVPLDAKGRACLSSDLLEPGARTIQAVYTSDGGEEDYHPSTSPNIHYTVAQQQRRPKVRFWQTIWFWALVVLLLFIAAIWLAS
jgi:FtsP/CotA-like multicopper oxidase with cupredoxin domain